MINVPGERTPNPAYLAAKQIEKKEVIERNRILALNPEELDIKFPGFLSGNRLEKTFNEKDFLPSPELIDAIIFAGKEDFAGLQQYTYDHIQNASVDLKIDPQASTTHSFPVPNDNIFKALVIVERFMVHEHRRTGEPGIAHIYRTILRTSEIIDYYNNRYNTLGTHIRFTPEIAEIAYLTAVLHDFVEDQLPQNDHTFEKGEAKAIYFNTDGKPDARFFLRRALYKNRTLRYKGNAEKDMELDIDPPYVPFLDNALKALNSSNVKPHLILEHLFSHLHTRMHATSKQNVIPLLDIDQYVLHSIPVYIKAGADRPDNLATYFHYKNQLGDIMVTPREKIYKKALENLVMFNEAELHMLSDGPEYFLSAEIFETDQDDTFQKDDTLQSPSSLPFFPSRWASLILLGLNPNQMYTIPEKGGLPQLI